ncbi:Ig-like domain-containing protein [Pseudactinotalea terrae]|uniref:Ig-like domain-containing protein n=1 Tax=Pseudactinotalea terrae TaxID=1743262 RepID=UPI0012E179E5|nr:Ig-like domain-containing protein [Pseudactinotalea terrae]
MPSTRLRWLRDRKRVASALVVALVVGTIVALSLNYRGVATADVELNDGGVWVSNENSVLVGRLNYPVREIDATLAADTPDIDLLQRGDDVLLRDPSAGMLRRIDTVNVQFSGASVMLPPQAQVSLGEGAVAVLDPADGRLWVTAPTDLAVIEEATVAPTATFGEGAHMTMGDDGTVYVLDVVDNEILTYPPEVWEALSGQEVEGAPAATDGTDGTDEPTSEATDGGAASQEPEPEESSTAQPEVTVLDEEIDLTTAQVQITAVGDEVVVLAYEAEDGTLTLVRPDQDPVDLSALDVDHASALLQATSRNGESVAIAARDALVTVPLTGGDPRVVPSTQPGTPAQPVQVNSCVHSAWAGGVPSYLRVCGDAEAEEQQVPQAAVNAELVFRVNRNLVVLNDLQSGDVWMLEDRLYLVENWEDVISSTSEEEETEDPSEAETDEVPLDREAENQDPTANPDQFGVRPGRTIVLPVLDNDRDPDGDLLTVATYTQPAESFGTVEAILGGRALQVRLTPDASGSAEIEYGISDGRDGQDSSTIRLDVSAATQNGAPEQTDPIEAEVVAGQAVEVNILNDVRDPDGDDVYLSGAQAQDTLNVSVRPDGTVTITDLGIRTGLQQVVVDVSDGQLTEQATIDLEVLPDTAAPPQAVFDFATGFVGSPIVVEPLVNDIDPNGKPLDLAIVTPTNGGEQRTDTDKDSFTFEASAAGSYYLTYVVTDDDGLNAEGLVRIDVVQPSTELAPVAVSDTALLPPDGSVVVDVLDNDSDPAGGVLAVQSIDVPRGVGLQVAILDHRILRITSEQVLREPVTIGYTVSNGTRSAQGAVTVIPLSGQSDALGPQPHPDAATVRTGDHVTIPVLRNDTHPNGLEFHVSGIEVPDDMPGLPFVSQDLVRFAAPDEPGTYRFTYTVTDENERTDSATITIYVEARGEEANAPPQPADVEVRAFAGERIRIPIDIYGIDPDGDSVQLVGPTTSPERGRIVDVQSGFIDYIAYNSVEGGTDSFTFTVRDRQGALGEATVTIGVIPPPATNRSPVTAADEITVRPDRNIQADVLLNDTDPDGDQLTFGDPAVVDPPEGLDVGVEEGLLTFTSPSEEGTYTIQYRADDTHGGNDIGSLTVTVDEDATLMPPVALDDLVPATQLIDAVSLDVDVLANDYDPDGSSADLTVSLPGGEDTIAVLDDGRLRIPVTPTRQVVTYQVTDVDGESTYAFVEVPGTEDTGPVLRSDVALEVDSGEELLVELEDTVVSLAGRTVRLYDLDGVMATNSDGGPYVVDEDTLRFVSAADYAGPAAITFSATDFADINAADVIYSVITIPIEVIATTQQPPTFRNGSMELEAGGDPVSLDIGRLADDRDTELSDLELTIGDVPAGFSASLEGGVILTASADLDTPRGTVVELPVQVSDGDNPPVEGVITLTATGSRAPLLVANDDDIGEVHQGESVSVPVLGNDTNPFPGEPRTIVDVFVETGEASASIQGDQVVVTPAPSYDGRLVVVYTVQDATEESERWRQARVTGTVLGVPEAPARPAIESVGNREVVVDITPPDDNGAPITGYEVTASGGPTVACPTTTCRITGLTNDVTYTFTVVAINEVGTSEPSASSAEARPDVSPGPVAAPSVEFGDSELRLAWSAPANEGSPIHTYDVQISPPPPSGQSQISLDAGATSYTWTGLTNGVTYEFRIRAHNDAPEAGAWGDWSRGEYPSAPPATPATPSMTRIDTPAGGQVQARWTAPNDNGDSIDTYHVTLYRNGVVYRTVTVGDDTLTRLFDVENGYDYSVSVVAENRSGRSPASAQSAAVTSFGAPGQVTAVSAAPTGNSGQITVSYSRPSDNGQAIQRFEYRLSGGGSGNLGASPATIGGLSNGTGYTVQVRACNTYCGAWSAASAEAAPYGPPATPNASHISSSVGSGENGRTVGFSWTYPTSSNGAAITASQFQVDNGGSQNGGRTGSTSVTGGWEETHRFRMRVQNEYGQWSGWSDWQSRKAGADPTPPIPPSVTMLHGRDAQGQQGCTHASCAFLDFSYDNLPSANYTIQFYASGESGVWRSYTATLSGDGRYNSTTYRGQPGEVIRVVITGGGNTYEDSITWPNS